MRLVKLSCWVEGNGLNNSPLLRVRKLRCRQSYCLWAVGMSRNIRTVGLGLEQGIWKAGGETKSSTSL